MFVASFILKRSGFNMLKTMENIISNSNNMKQTVVSLRNELNVLKKAYSDMRFKNLSQENSELSRQVELTKNKLIQLESANGIKQIPLPADVSDVAGEPPKPLEKCVAKPLEKRSEEPPKPPKKETKPKVVAAETEEVHVGRLDLRVGQIIQVEKHPDADSLYVSKIKCGDPNLRTVVSGLVKFVPITELLNRKVVVLCNLKPAKMRGVLSEAMVMCASTPEKVEVLNVPDTSEPGDLVCCEGFDRIPDAQLNPKKKIFESVAVDLKTNDCLEACFKGKVLSVVGKGAIKTQSLKNVNIK